MLNTLLTGLLLGGIFALVAMGLTLQYGVARIMNLSYGELLIAGAFASFFIFTNLQLSPLVGLALIAPASFLLNWAIYRLLLMPLVKRARTRAALEIDSILATFGVLFIAQGLIVILFGGSYYSYSYLAVPVEVLGIPLAANRLVAFAFASIIGVALFLLLTRTRIGVAIRAVAIDPVAAGLVAIDVRRVSALAFALGGALVACGGALLSTFLTFSASMGVAFTMKALIIVIAGGVGSIQGTLVAGLVLGLSETLVATYVDPGLTLASTYFLFLIILLVRPAGLFGRVAR